MEKIRKGDNVVVLTGKDKGKRGIVMSRVDADHVEVEGVNVVKRHTRPNPCLFIFQTWRCSILKPKKQIA